MNEEHPEERNNRNPEATDLVTPGSVPTPPPNYTYPFENIDKSTR